MPVRVLPDQSILAALFTYEFETGRLLWKARPVSMFANGRHSAAHTCARWNATFAGREALAARHGAGYRHGNLLGVNALSHRVIWKLVSGEDAIEVDHIDGDRSNNRWSNLRSVPRTINRRNSARHKDNRSGVTGVRQAVHGGWQAFIGADYGMNCLGVFQNFEDAVAARKAAEREHNFHPNHGRNPAPS